MRVFYNGAQRELTYNACPAGHLPAAECAKDWFYEDGAPRTFPVRFVDGESLVPDNLGRYLVAQKVCRTHSLIFPGSAAA